jgi:hypothetical protein
MEAPIVTYVGEICQPSIRGILTSCAGVSVMLGFTTVYTLGSLTNWRNTALYCCAVPVSTMIAICFVPGYFQKLKKLKLEIKKFFF